MHKEEEDTACFFFNCLPLSIAYEVNAACTAVLASYFGYIDHGTSLNVCRVWCINVQMEEFWCFL